MGKLTSDELIQRGLVSNRNKAPTDIDAPSTSEARAHHDKSMRGRKAEATPFNFSTADGAISFDFWINPSECSWRIPLRTTIEQIQGGAVHHEWDSTGIGLQSPQKFDQPIINFTFQSGNVAPRSWLDIGDIYPQGTKGANFIGGNTLWQQVDTNPNDTSRITNTQGLDGAISGGNTTNQPTVPKGLCNFYDFMALLNQPNITADGLPNYVVIQYHSLMLPQIELQGFFTQEGVQWTDTADNPNGISSWGASFVVFFSSPALFDRQGLRDEYRNLFQ